MPENKIENALSTVKNSDSFILFETVVENLNLPIKKFHSISIRTIFMYLIILQNVSFTEHILYTKIFRFPSFYFIANHFRLL